MSKTRSTWETEHHFRIQEADEENMISKSNTL